MMLAIITGAVSKRRGGVCLRNTSLKGDMRGYFSNEDIFISESFLTTTDDHVYKNLDRLEQITTF